MGWAPTIRAAELETHLGSTRPFIHSQASKGLRISQCRGVHHKVEGSRDSRCLLAAQEPLVCLICMADQTKFLISPTGPHFHHNGTHSCLVYEAMGPGAVAVSMDWVPGEAVMDGQN
jgi:hypothetical protein